MPKRGENIRKRKDGRWEGRYKNGIKPDGTVLYRSVYGKTYREVKEKLISAKNKKDLPVHQFSTEKIFSEILYLWEETNRVRIKKSTAQKYDYLIKTHIIPDLGGLKVSQITASAINLFLQKKLTDGRLDGKGKLSPSYVNSMTIIVKSAMEFAVSEQLCPPLKTTIHKPPVPKNEVRILSKEEQAAIEHYVNKTLTPTHVGILISLHTGLRIGEICALSWKDIDFCNRVIHVHHTVTRVKNDNANLSEKTQLILDLPKTKSSNRTVPISSALFSVISEFKKISVSDFVVSDKPGFISPRTYEYRYHCVLRSCRVRPVNYHVLRHTFASRCITAGMDVKSLSEILGHRNATITLNTYVHPSLEQKREALEKLDIELKL